MINIINFDNYIYIILNKSNYKYQKIYLKYYFIKNNIYIYIYLNMIYLEKNQNNLK